MLTQTTVLLLISSPVPDIGVPKVLEEEKRAAADRELRRPLTGELLKEALGGLAAETRDLGPCTLELLSPNAAAAEWRPGGSAARRQGCSTVRQVATPPGVHSELFETF